MDTQPHTVASQSCNSCKASLHRTCYELLKRHAGETQQPLRCPYCRVVWEAPVRENTLSLVKRQISSMDDFLEAAESKKMCPASIDAAPSKRTTVVRIRRNASGIIQGCDVYIGRQCTMGGWNLQRSKWANPFSVKECGSAEVAVVRYREWIFKQPQLLQQLSELRGKVLGCWCKPGACHGDVLIELCEKMTHK